MKIPKGILLSLVHIIHYGKSFNKFNAMLDAEQQKHFYEAGAEDDVLKIRDPFTTYADASTDIDKLYVFCGVSNTAEVIDSLNNDEDKDELILVDDDWWVKAMSQAITRYKERYSFFMIEREYHSDLKLSLGDEGFTQYMSGIKKLLGSKMVCGNADSSKYKIEEFLKDNGTPYTTPPHPYMEKRDERFAELRRMVKEFMSKKNE